MIYQGKARYPVHEIILHTSATPNDWWTNKSVEQMRDEIRHWHVDGNGWRDIGYHRVVGPGGRMATGRSLWQIGAHVMERNRGTIGICMVPVKTHDGIKNFEDYFTAAQRVTVKDYIAQIQREFGGIKWVTGHNDYAPKECPGFRVKTEDWL